MSEKRKRSKIQLNKEFSKQAEKLVNFIQNMHRVANTHKLILAHTFAGAMNFYFYISKSRQSFWCGFFEQLKIYKYADAFWVRCRIDFEGY